MFFRNRHSANILYKVSSRKRLLSTSISLSASIKSLNSIRRKLSHSSPNKLLSKLTWFNAWKLMWNGARPAEATSTDVSRPTDESGTADQETPAQTYDYYSWRAKSPNARLVYTRDVETANREITKLRPGPVGFDMEWKPTFFKGQIENPVALIQLANDETVLLIQISAMNQFPDKLRQLLENVEIVKAGVGIQGDCKKLYKDYAIPTRNCVDLSLLARTVDNARWKGKYVAPIGLARLCEAYEQLTLTKGKITRSNWELQLSDAQQQYAADDSHVGYVLYRRLSEMAAAMTPPPALVWYTFDFMKGRLVDPFIGVRWWPDNPNYDPGPPPPPKPPKERKDGEVVNGQKGAGREGSAQPRRGGKRGNRGNMHMSDFPRASDVTAIQPTGHGRPAYIPNRGFGHRSSQPVARAGVVQEHSLGTWPPQQSQPAVHVYTQAIPGSSNAGNHVQTAFPNQWRGAPSDRGYPRRRRGRKPPMPEGPVGASQGYS